MNIVVITVLCLFLVGSIAASVYFYLKHKKLAFQYDSRVLNRYWHMTDTKMLDLNKSDHRQEFIFHTYWHLVSAFQFLQLLETGAVSGTPKTVKSCMESIVELDTALRKYLSPSGRQPK